MVEEDPQTNEVPLALVQLLFSESAKRNKDDPSPSRCVIINVAVAAIRREIVLGGHCCDAGTAVRVLRKRWRKRGCGLVLRRIRLLPI